jgi:hypothetical protein
MTELRDETGLIGKIAILWILVLALVGVGAIDTASIAFTTYRLSDVATRAAGEGALVYKRTRDVRDACERVSEVVTREDPTVKVVPGGCEIERPTGDVTVEVRKKASTLVAHQLPWTEDYAIVEVTETSGVPSL